METLERTHYRYVYQSWNSVTLENTQVNTFILLSDCLYSVYKVISALLFHQYKSNTFLVEFDCFLSFFLHLCNVMS